MVRGILFDMGGTLDGDGVHWLDRFASLYADAGFDLPWDRVRRAFDAAELRAATDEAIATAHLEEMIERHVGWQLASMDVDHHQRDRIAGAFAAGVRAAATVNVPLLASLAARGFRLGVVSNGCGNVSVLCDDLGYSPYLSAVVDSRRVGLYKPDAAIFLHAAATLGAPSADTMMVGDSIDRDMRPAKSVGMLTAWLEGQVPRECPDPTVVDVRLRRLADLPQALESWQALAR